MEKKNFFIKLIPPRASFQLDMTEEEKKVMLEHVVYWKGLLNSNIAILYGPVMDPAGGYGIGIVEVEAEAVVRKILESDPTIKGLSFRFEIFPMRVVRK